MKINNQYLLENSPSQTLIIALRGLQECETWIYEHLLPLKVSKPLQSNDTLDFKTLLMNGCIPESCYLSRKSVTVYHLTSRDYISLIILYDSSTWIYGVGR